MKNLAVTAALLTAAAAMPGAQDKMMPTAGKPGAPMAMGATYTGCLERSDDGRFALAHAMAGGAMAGKEPMMRGDDKMAPGDDKMTHDKMSMDGDSMSGEALALTATRVKLAKYVGQKVSVTGTPGAENFAVASIKPIAKSCR